MLYSLDRTERLILESLQKEGRISNVELAQAVGLSESPCLRRVRGLEEQGVITGYSANIDQRRVGLQVTAFVQVQLEKHDDQKTRAFLE
ncbi:MAG: Lrp/AsnC family transcriptional regulator [Congregibacter sp.]|nr:Lrp/AsnC family transcriptional regulator [Congregibacter sp.]